MSATPGAGQLRARVLVVDDEQPIARLMLRVIEGAGHDVTHAPSPQAALQLVEDGTDFDLLVTDVRMPVMSGPELAAHLESLLPELRTLFVSGWPGAPDPTTDRPARLLGKPFTAQALLDAVAEVLRPVD